MGYIPLAIPPGVVKPGTKYDARGRWFHTNLIRWHEKAMKPIGGWTIVKDSAGADVDVGSAIRGILPWQSNAQQPHLVLATYCELFIFTDSGAGDTLTDISPVGVTCGGQNSVVSGAKYGLGLYGAGKYSWGGYGTAALTEANTWQLDTFGEDLVAVAYADGKLYKWDLSVGVGTVAAVVPNAPLHSRGVVVTPERMVMLLAPDNNGDGVGDGRAVAWSDREDIESWAATINNTAGDYELTTPGEIMAGRRSRNETLIWTTTDLHTARFIGGDLVYSFHELGANCGALSRHSMVVIDGKAVWMGWRNFFVYDGFVKPLESEVADYVFNDINLTQAHKITSFARAEFGEITWHYPSLISVENDKYVTINFIHGHWSVGDLERTAGADRGAFPYPVAADAQGLLYRHEFGISRLDVDGVTEIVPTAESGPIELGDGEQVLTVLEIIPDTRTLGDASASLFSSFYPTDVEVEHGPFPSNAPTTPRITGRWVRLKVEGSSDWRVGTYRLNVEAGERR